MGSFFSLGKSSNDTQENSKDALKKEEELKKVQEVQEENAKLNRDKTNLAREKDKLADQNKTLIETNQNLAAEKERLERESKNLAAEKENLTKDKENLTTALSTAKTQAEQTSQKLNELERRHAPYQKLEKLYEVFLEVKDRLNFNFVATTHSAMDLIASVLSDSKYYLESLYNKASQELSDKRSDKGEKLAELFDLLFEYIKDSKFERLKEPSAYDHSCKKLYPEQNTSQKIQRVVLRGYTCDNKIACYTIVDMGS
ncbi:M protein [Helicobacter pylori]|nr:M protein [Helicobacter pylori]